MKKKDELSAEKRYEILKCELECHQSELNMSDKTIKGFENQILDLQYRIKKEKKAREISRYMVSVLKPPLKELETEIEKEKKSKKEKKEKTVEKIAFERIDPMPC